MATRKTAARTTRPRAGAKPVRAAKTAAKRAPTRAVKKKPVAPVPPLAPEAVAVAAPVVETAATRYATFLDSPAPLDVAQMQDLDAAIAADGGDIRRAALAVLTRSGAELAQATRSEEGARTAAFLVACTERYRAPLAAMLELLDTAAERVLLALSPRPDSAVLLAAARLEAGVDAGPHGHA